MSSGSERRVAKDRFEVWCRSYGLEFIRRLAEDGALDDELARAADISLVTFKKWMRRYPRFRNAVELGRREADLAVVEAVYKKATGYNVSTSKTHKLKRVDYDPDTGKKIREYEELAVGVDEDHVAPDLRAGIFWLKSRQGERWNEKAGAGELSESGVIELPEADSIDPHPEDGE